MDNKKINFFEVLNALNESLYKRQKELVDNQRVGEYFSNDLAKEENDKAGIVISSRIKNITEQVDLFSGIGTWDS